jgi:acetolactate synthase-1/2/3 large subunit
MECGQGLPAPTRLPYLPEMARGALSQVRTLVIAGAEEPVPYFAETPGPCRVVPPSTAVEVLARPTEDVVGALEALADDLHARRSPAIATRPALVRPAGEALHVHAAVATIAAALPEGSIVVDEGVSAGGAFLGVAPGCPRHSYLSLTGGATGLGLPCAIGAALACPDRKVLALVGDGSALYTIQALWTQARQGVDVVTVICANDGYRILELETIRRHGRVGPAARALIDFARPPIDWLDVARGFGVPATRVGSVSELMDALNRSFAERGPHLIEMRLPRRSNDGPPGA